MNHTQTLHGTAIYAYIDPQNHLNVGIYGIHGVSGIDWTWGLVESRHVDEPISPMESRPPE